jgi:hypothetical protein
MSTIDLVPSTRPRTDAVKIDVFAIATSGGETAIGRRGSFTQGAAGVGTDTGADAPVFSAQKAKTV